MRQLDEQVWGGEVSSGISVFLGDLRSHGLLDGRGVGL